MLYALALLAGCVAGSRTFTAPAAFIENAGAIVLGLIIVGAAR